MVETAGTGTGGARSILIWWGAPRLDLRWARGAFSLALRPWQTVRAFALRQINIPVQ